MYTIRALLERNRVEIIFDGAHDYDYLVFSQELKDAALAVRSNQGHFDLLVDFTAGQVLPQENAAQSERNIAWCIANGMRKSANVMTTIIQKIQVKRVSHRDEKLGYFETREEAEKWLDS